MNTLYLVMAEFEAAEIKLEQLCEEHFGMALPQAKRKAASYDLPVPFYKKTGKSGYYCRATDWAEYIDHNAEAARKEWQKMNGVA
ncbi:MAG: pyocin activator PrtN family protein [Saccharospirillaceae bacterium]|nr:pyocin activator PrtN family protein [Saccharospirillaceae bacterium]